MAWHSRILGRRVVLWYIQSQGPLGQSTLSDTNSRAGGGLRQLVGCQSRGAATEFSLSLRDLAKLVVGVVRQPPLRVDSHLDRRLDNASTVSETLAAVVDPHQLPPHEAEKLTELREEVSRLQARCENAERDLVNETQLGTSAEAALVRANEDFYSVHDSNQVLRAENADLVDRVRDQDIAVAEQAHVIQSLNNRCRSSEGHCAAAMRYVDQERERMKTGLVLYNAELSKLRQYLGEHSRGKVSSPSPRTTALLAENASLRRANSVLRRNSAEHGLNTDALVISTAGMSVSGIDWELLGLGHDHSGLFRLLSPSSTAELSDDDGLDSSFTESSSVPSVALSGYEISADEPSEHSFIRTTVTSSSLTLPSFTIRWKLRRFVRRRVTKCFSPQTSTPPTIRFGAKIYAGGIQASCVPKARSKKTQPATVPLKARSGHKKARSLSDSSVAISTPLKKLRSPPASTLTDGCIDNNMGEVLDLTSDDVVTSLPGKDSSPFSSTVVSFFPRKDGRPRRSTSVASELRMRENLEKELADDDFMLGLTAEGSVADTMDSAPSKKGSQNHVSSSSAVAEVAADGSAGDGHHALTGEGSVVKAPVEAEAPVDDAPASGSSVTGASGFEHVHSPSPLPPVPKPGPAVPISQLFNDVIVDLVELETSDSPAKDAETGAADGVSGTESSVSHLASDSVVAPTTPVVSSAPRLAVLPNITVVPVRTRARSLRAAGVPTQPAIPRHGRKHPKTHGHCGTVSRTWFAAVGAQKKLNVSLSESAPKDHVSPLDFAFLALMYNVHIARHPWWVRFDRMPDEPLTFELGKLVKGVRISIRA
ncbi:hypothetical protein PHMEG_00019319 [Phytophthora megakarya]|uniref:Uncharacterized protein n=1 Tax=Phytophthora megakarya TaxID=4795 RepID=A0A225VT44_9STRA|nr:hypothetical protein PHMEG_00019319 [Phytophthora megakarya]